MGAPRVVDDRLVFEVDDPEHRLRLVQLACDDDLVAEHRFRRTGDGWTLSVPRPPVDRLEYRLLVTGDGDDATVILDPDNPNTVATAFGHRSVAHLPGYVEPAWCNAPTVDAVRTHRLVTTPVGDVPVTAWAPLDLDDEHPAPLLVVHDGPEYDTLAQLGTWAAAGIAAGLPRFRMALLQPVDRDGWYASNPAWPAAVAAIVAALDRDLSRSGPLVTMGASLGGLAALQVALAGTLDVAGVFSQSGSFFQPLLDPQEAKYPGFDRIRAWVDDVGRRPIPGIMLDVVLTCGEHEENHANNLAMADLLASRGHRVTWQTLPDLHNYTAWRDGLAPELDDLVGRVW